MSNMNSFFDELVEAKKAMETLPMVQAELARANGEAQTMRDRFEAECRRVSDMQLALAELEDKLAAKEAALSDATKSQAETQDRLDVVLGAIRGVSRELGETVALVDPLPPPARVVEPVIHTAPGIAWSDPHEQGQSVAAPTSDTTSTGQDGIEPVINPPSEWHTPQVTELPGTFEPGSGFRPENPTQDQTGTTAPATEPMNSAMLQDANTTGMASTTESPSGQSDIPPTASSTSTFQSPSAQTPSANSSGVATPSDPLPYWHKPTNLSWREWVAQGNQKGPWVVEGSAEWNEPYFGSGQAPAIHPHD